MNGYIKLTPKKPKPRYVARTLTNEDIDRILVLCIKWGVSALTLKGALVYRVPV